MAREPENASELVRKGLPHEGSPTCSSSDGVALYTDGHSYCFACSTYIPSADGPGSEAPQRDRKVIDVEVQEYAQQGRPLSIKSRGLTQATCKFWDYRVWEKPSGEFVQLAIYKDAQGVPVGVKVRPEDKDKIHWGAGSAKGQLYGRWLWPKGGKRLVITEGELDALSVSQAYNNKFAVASVPNGAAEAVKAVAANLDWILSFDEVVFAFDGDEKGQTAAVECAKILPAGRARIVKWPPQTKDASDLLQRGEPEKITWAIHSAEAYRPDGILDARSLSAACLASPTWGIPWPFPDMTTWTYGRLGGELYCLGAGYGIGKTDALTEIIACTLKGEVRATGEKFPPEACALFGYESGPVKSKKTIAGKLFLRRFHLPQSDTNLWTQEELTEAMDVMDGPLWDAGGKLFINDNRGAGDWESIKDRIRFLAHAEGVKHAFIDPISALVEEEGEGTDERKFLDKMVREAAKLAVELNITIYLFSHLTRPKEGASHEEGGQVRGTQFRGSNALGMFVDGLFGMERNTQAETQAERNLITFRYVKDRKSGNFSGETTQACFDPIHGVIDPARFTDTQGEPIQFVGDV